MFHIQTSPQPSTFVVLLGSFFSFSPALILDIEASKSLVKPRLGSSHQRVQRGEFKAPQSIANSQSAGATKLRLQEASVVLELSPAMATPSLPTPISTRFTLELEFVLCLSHPGYLQHLALTYPHLLNPPTSNKPATSKKSDPDSDAACFARYLAYLYSYWRTPEYAKYLTYPGATLRNLELLQQEQFRKDLIRPDVIARLEQMPVPKEEETRQEEEGEGMDMAAG